MKKINYVLRDGDWVDDGCWDDIVRYYSFNTKLSKGELYRYNRVDV